MLFPCESAGEIEIVSGRCLTLREDKRLPNVLKENELH